MSMSPDVVFSRSSVDLPNLDPITLPKLVKVTAFADAGVFGAGASSTVEGVEVAVIEVTCTDI